MAKHSHRVSRVTGLLLVFLVFGAYTLAPAQDQGQSKVEPMAETPVFQVSTIARTAHAINYRNRAGATKIDFVGTSLMPRANGEAKVESKKGYIEIEVEFKSLGMPTQFGAEYLTYVLWAITPAGRAVNLGEIPPAKNGKGKLNVTTDLQVFALLVTAEPYFAVRQPSDLIVMENEARKDTKGRIEMIDAKYELLQRGQYAKLANPLSLSLDLKRVPLELYEARNAIDIAKSLGASQYAPELLAKANASLEQAESLQARKGNKRTVAMPARAAVQIAEDARALAVKREADERLAAERRAAAEREALARSQAEEEAKLRAEAEAQRQREASLRQQAEQAKDAAEKQRLEAELAAAKAQADVQLALREKEQARREKEAAMLAVNQAQAERERLAQAKAEAEAAAEQARIEREEARKAAEQASLEREEARKAAETLAALKARAESAAEQAKRERDEIRARMEAALKRVVETRETARGLIVNLPDILFDFGKATLRPEAREVLSRMSGIFLVTPGYRLLIEGHTDSIGSDEFNMKLSEQRAQAVHDYLMESGLSGEMLTTKGFGKTQPIADNGTAEGRQKNRRVEIVVESIPES